MNWLGLMMGLRAGCLPLAVEVGRCTGVSYRHRVCKLCDSGEVEDYVHLFISCHKLNCIRQKLLSHWLTLSSNFTHLSDHSKCTFLLRVKDSISIFFNSSNVSLKTITFVQELVHHQQHYFYGYISLPSVPITWFCKLSVTSKPTLAEQPLISCCSHFNNHWICMVMYRRLAGRELKHDCYTQ